MILFFPLSLQTTTKLQKLSKVILIGANYQLNFKIQNKKVNAFWFKYSINGKFNSTVICKFPCGPWILSFRMLTLWILTMNTIIQNAQNAHYAHFVKDLKKFQLTKKKIESKASAVRGHLLFSHHSSSFDRFLMVTTDNSEFYWVERESVIIESNFYRETWNLNHAPIDRAYLACLGEAATTFLQILITR